MFQKDASFSISSNHTKLQFLTVDAILKQLPSSIQAKEIVTIDSLAIYICQQCRGAHDAAHHTATYNAQRGVQQLAKLFSTFSPTVNMQFVRTLGTCAYIVKRSSRLCSFHLFFLIHFSSFNIIFFDTKFAGFHSISVVQLMQSKQDVNALLWGRASASSANSLGMSGQRSRSSNSIYSRSMCTWVCFPPPGYWDLGPSLLRTLSSNSYNSSSSVSLKKSSSSSLGGGSSGWPRTVSNKNGTGTGTDRTDKSGKVDVEVSVLGTNSLSHSEPHPQLPLASSPSHSHSHKGNLRILKARNYSGGSESSLGSVLSGPISDSPSMTTTGTTSIAGMGAGMSAGMSAGVIAGWDLSRGRCQYRMRSKAQC